MKRRAITSAYIIVSLFTAILIDAIIYMMYIFLFPTYVLPANFIAGNFGASIPQILPIISNITAQLNAVFIIIPVGIFIFLLLAPYLFEPLSGLFGGGQSDY